MRHQRIGFDGLVKIAMGVMIGPVAVIMGGLLGCRNEKPQSATQAPPPPPPPPALVPAYYRLERRDVATTNLLCIRPDALASRQALEFGESASDQSTGDVAALVFRFSVNETGVSGQVTEVTGEAGSAKPFTELALDLRKRTIRFA